MKIVIKNIKKSYFEKCWIVDFDVIFDRKFSSLTLIGQIQWKRQNFIEEELVEYIIDMIKAPIE